MRNARFRFALSSEVKDRVRNLTVYSAHHNTWRSPQKSELANNMENTVGLMRGNTATALQVLQKGLRDERRAIRRIVIQPAKDGAEFIGQVFLGGVLFNVENQLSR